MRSLTETLDELCSMDAVWRRADGIGLIQWIQGYETPVERQLAGGLKKGLDFTVANRGMYFAWFAPCD